MLVEVVDQPRGVECGNLRFWVLSNKVDVALPIVVVGTVWSESGLRRVFTNTVLELDRVEGISYLNVSDTWCNKTGVDRCDDGSSFVPPVNCELGVRRHFAVVKNFLENEKPL